MKPFPSISSQPKEATQAAKAADAKILQSLPFSDKQGFDDAKLGLIAPRLNQGVIKKDRGSGCWGNHRLC
jgi:alkyl sulfatase BDS1-like metallo-beta-lactamase superfamily hydrolase